MDEQQKAEDCLNLAFPFLIWTSVILLLACDLVANLAFQFGYVLTFAKPAAPMEMDNRFLLAVSLVDRHSLSNVDIRCSNNEVVK